MARAAAALVAWACSAAAGGAQSPSHREGAVAVQRGGRPVRCADEPMRSTGTKYYYCDCQADADPACVPGRDGSSCTDPARPCRTAWKERFRTMAAGDTVALCRGGSFLTDAGHTRNASCRAGFTTTCDLRDYTPAAHPAWARDQAKRPLITGPRVGFVPRSDVHHEGFRFFNLRSRGIDPQGSFHGGLNSSDGEVCNVAISDGPDLGVMLGDGVRWTIRECQFARLGGQGILGGCDDCVIDSNFFANDSYGTRGFFDHPVYVNSPGGKARRMRVTNNEIHGCRPVGGSRTGTPLLVVHGEFEDLLIENNLVQCDHPDLVSGNQYGIGVGAAYPTAEQFTRTVIRRNRVVGNALGIWLDCAPDSVIEGNVIVMRAGSSNGGAIQIGTREQQAGGDTLSDRITVRNNTAYYPGPQVGPAFQSDHVGAGRWGGTGHAFTNNVAYYRVPSGSCLALGGTAHDYAVVANNACNVPAGTSIGSGFVRLAASPFVDAEADLRPVPGGPLSGTGTSAAACPILGTAGAPCCAPVSPTSSAWDPADAGTLRAGPCAIGALRP